MKHRVELIILSSIEKLSYKGSAAKYFSNLRRHISTPLLIELNTKTIKTLTKCFGNNNEKGYLTAMGKEKKIGRERRTNLWNALLIEVELSFEYCFDNNMTNWKPSLIDETFHSENHAKNENKLKEN